jgi:hypothetical protein
MDSNAEFLTKLLHPVNFSLQQDNGYPVQFSANQITPSGCKLNDRAGIFV